MAKEIPTSSSIKSDTFLQPNRQGSGVFSWPSAGSVLFVSVCCILVLSLIMVASASIPFSVSYNNPELLFFYRQLIFMSVGLVVAAIVYFCPLKWFYILLMQGLALLILIILLILTLAIGDVTNGSRRWIEIGSVNLQVSELAKLVMVVFTADFVVRRASEVRNSWDGFLRLSMAISIVIGAILFQPDFGSFVILIGTILAMFFVAGAPKGQFTILGVLATGLLIGALFIKDYRITRLMSFRYPFDDVGDTDYQLARSLIAFGRGQFTGVGYGESIQKLSHLPEAHTDFLLAITGEELGFVGVASVLILEALIIASTMRISYMALKKRQMRLSYTAFGFGIIFIGQGVINAAMNMGIMPTKGLTMPFFSYGGSSMVVCLIMFGFLMNIHKNSPRIPASECRHY